LEQQPVAWPVLQLLVLFAQHLQLGQQRAIRLRLHGA
jgi:hypothetical protein